MAFLWLLEKTENCRGERLASKILGAVPIRMIASKSSLLSLKKMLDSIELPKAIVINENDFSKEDISEIESHFDEIEVLKSGAKDSTVSISELAFKVQEALSQPVSAGRRLIINFENMTLMIPDQENSIPLSHKEAKLINAFLEAEGETLSREDLIEAVWAGMKVSRSTIDSQISRLRKKLSPTLIEIESIYGGGYKLNSD